MRCEKFIYDRRIRKRGSGSFNPAIEELAEEGYLQQVYFVPFSNDIYFDENQKIKIIDKPAATSNGKKYTRHLRTTIDFGTKIQCCSTLELDFKTTFQLNFFFFSSSRRLVIFFSLNYLFFFAVKQKGDGDERGIAFLLPPREGEASVKAKRRAAKDYNRRI